MEEKKITIPNIHCDHCAMTIKRELFEIEGVKKLDADIETKQLTVAWDHPATWKKIISTLTEIGYPHASQTKTK